MHKTKTTSQNKNHAKNTHPKIEPYTPRKRKSHTNPKPKNQKEKQNNQRNINLNKVNKTKSRNLKPTKSPTVNFILFYLYTVQIVSNTTKTKHSK